MKTSSAYAFAAISQDIEKPRRVEAYWEDENLFTLKVHGREDGECVVVSLDAELAAAQKSSHGLIELRKHLAWYVKGIPHASELRQQLVRVKTLEEIIDILQTVPALVTVQ